MKNTLKKIITLALSLLTLVSCLVIPMSKASAAITYNNTTSTSLNCSISSSGQLDVMMSVNGKKNITTRIEVELYVEKRILGIFWSRVDIGCTNNLWQDFVNGDSYANIFSTQLNSTGTYRVSVKYSVYGYGGAADIIDKTDTLTY